MFEGSYGCGKTHLALAICNYVIEHHGMTVMFGTVADFLDRIRSSYGGGEVSATEVFDSALDVGVLVLDDYGVERNNEWTEEEVIPAI